MKKYVIGALLTLVAFPALATSTLERNLAECTISTNGTFEEIVLKYIQTEDADMNVYSDYVLDYTQGDLYGASVDILGKHEQVRQRLFTSAMAEGDGVIGIDYRDYQMITVFNHSEVRINLAYEGRDQDDFATYTMSIDGYGPAYRLVKERVEDVLAQSEHYGRYDDPLCVTHFNLDDYISE